MLEGVQRGELLLSCLPPPPHSAAAGCALLPHSSSFFDGQLAGCWLAGCCAPPQPNLHLSKTQSSGSCFVMGWGRSGQLHPLCWRKQSEEQGVVGARSLFELSPFLFPFFLRPGEEENCQDQKGNLLTLLVIRKTFYSGNLLAKRLEKLCNSANSFPLLKFVC